VKQLGIPATEYAVKRLRNKQVANLVLLGALVEKTSVVSVRAMEKAIQTHVAERFRSLNLEAFKLGLELGRQAHG
jgi:2-oxoglutarate ferredoxin oxidoreductase subunit gamma